MENEHAAERHAVETWNTNRNITLIDIFIVEKTSDQATHGTLLA
jgi:hypothetical protein